MKPHGWLLLSTLAAGTAAAQLPLPGLIAAPDTRGPPPPFTPFGLVMSLGGGLQQFFGAPARDQVGTGGTWTFRVEAGSRMHFGAEAGYIGSAQSLVALGTDTHAALVSNGFDVLARANILTGWVRPYLAGGLSYQRFTTNGPRLLVSDAVNNVNVVGYTGAAGVAFRLHGVVLDARGSIGGPLSDSPIPDSNSIAWSLGATVGYEL
jgi:hypothetical protein